MRGSTTGCSRSSRGRRWRPRSAPRQHCGTRAAPARQKISFDLYKLLLYLRVVHAFDVLGDPVRRRILELLVPGEQSAGDITAVIRDEFSITQPAVSQHLKVLRDSGFTVVRAVGQRRLYAVDGAALREVDDWLNNFRQFWAPRLDALSTEIARGKRQRRLRPQGTDERRQH